MHRLLSILISLSGVKKLPFLFAKDRTEQRFYKSLNYCTKDCKIEHPEMRICQKSWIIFILSTFFFPLVFFCSRIVHIGMVFLPLLMSFFISATLFYIHWMWLCTYIHKCNFSYKYTYIWYKVLSLNCY